jgi:hypothetical protein
MSSQITVTGSYFALDEFLFLMETLPRAAKVQSVAVTPVAATEGAAVATTSLSMAIAIEFYTTDTSAGPASVPGPSEGAGAAPSGATGPAPTSTTGAG